MTRLPINEEKIIMLAVAKLYSDQSTYILNELKHRAKYEFNLSIKATDNFIKTVESALTDEQKEHLQEITDALNDGMTNLRQDLIKTLQHS